MHQYNEKRFHTPASVIKFPNITFTTVLYVDAINGLLKFKICVHTLNKIVTSLIENNMILSSENNVLLIDDIH